jgi:hypothetical protein
MAIIARHNSPGWQRSLRTILGLSELEDQIEEEIEKYNREKSKEKERR